MKGDRPFCNARSMARQAAGPEAHLFREWIAYGVQHYGAPFLADVDADTLQAPYMGAPGTIDRGRIALP